MIEVNNTDNYNKVILNSLNDLNANINHVLLCIMFISIFLILQLHWQIARGKIPISFSTALINI